MTRPGEPGLKGARDSDPTHNAFLIEGNLGAGGKKIVNERTMPGAIGLASASNYMQPLARFWMPVAVMLNKESAGGGRVDMVFQDGADHIHWQQIGDSEK